MTEHVPLRRSGLDVSSPRSPLGRPRHVSDRQSSRRGPYSAGRIERINTRARTPNESHPRSGAELRHAAEQDTGGRD